MLAMESFLRHLKALGVDWLIANPGTDFPPLAEAYGRCENDPDVLPKAIMVAHETVAVAMAHGYYLATGRPAAVMCHTNVGTANAVMGALNAASDRIPILLLAGRTPYSDHGLPGARSGPIHWGQEMMDQHGLMRGAAKWTYEWTLPHQARSIAVRMMEIATAAPAGPTYLTLPREIIAAEIDHEPEMPPHRPVAAPVADEDLLAHLSELIRESKNPLIVVSAAGRDREAVSALGDLSLRHGIPVVENAARYVNLPASHPNHRGYQTDKLLASADLVIALECEVPWVPSKIGPAAGAKIVHCGAEPLFGRYPMREFPASLYVQGQVASTLRRLDALLLAHPGRSPRSVWAEPRRTVAGTGELNAERVSAILHEFLDSDTVVVNEYPLKRAYCGFEEPGTYFGHTPAGGLGWGFGAALGIKLAAPNRRVVAALGDGSYIFANPPACHMAAAEFGLPVVTLVFDNRSYDGVRRSTAGMYPPTSSAADDMFLSDLAHAPKPHLLAEACGASAYAAGSEDELRKALTSAFADADHGRQALISARIAN